MLPWKCHSGNFIKLCGDCNNCTKFQFYTEKIFGDTPSFVMLQNFVHIRAIYTGENKTRLM